MDRPIITIPRGLLRQLRFDWDIDWRGQSMGETTGGVTQTVYNRFPRWVGSPTVLLVGQQIAQWRAIRAHARGMVGMYLVEMCDPAAFKFADTGDSFSASGIPFSTGETFSTGVGFAYEPTCLASKAAAMGAESIRVKDTAAKPVIGQIMSFDRWPFMVVSVSTVSAGVYDLGIQMPLRTAIPKDGVIKMRGEGLFEATDESMGRAIYEPGLSARVGLSFREVLKR